LTLETGFNAFSFGVFRFGLKNETEAFKYGNKIGEFVKVTVSLMCMQPWKCVTFYYNITLDCLTEHGEFLSEIEIGR